MKGYDIAGEEDFLDRKRLAQQIFDIIANTAPEWSVRIGVFGEWGVGKSTVLNYLLTIADEKEYPIIRLNPWTVQTLEELKDQFHNAILGNDRIVPFIKSFGAKLFEKSPTVRIGHLREDISKSIKRFESSKNVTEAFSKLVFGSAKAFLRIKEEELTAIVRGITTQKKRIIVAIDDLDRADPKIIPTLLLSLNEILDLPGFTFILPFDRDKVAKSLSENHKAYGTGHDFLEKIIDFSFVIPEPSIEQRNHLFKSQISGLCKFVPSAVIDNIQKCLPANPRKIKTVVRHLKVLEGEVVRHNTEELDWYSLLFSTLLQIESLQFAEDFRKEVIADNSALDEEDTSQRIGRALNPTPNWNWYALTKGEGKELRDKQLDALIAKSGDIDQENSNKKDRIKMLVNTWFRSLSPYTLSQIDYTLNLLNHPHQITWKEFGEVFNLWEKEKSLTGINLWVQTQAHQRHSEPALVAQELLVSLLSHRNNQLDKAAQTTTLEEHDSYMALAQVALELCDHMLTYGLESVGTKFYRTESFFESYVGFISNWIHFRTNLTDKAAREQEALLLKKWLQLETDNKLSIRQLLEQKIAGFSWGDEKDKKMQQLLRECLGDSEDDIIEEALNLFSTQGAVVKLHDNAYDGRSRVILLNPKSNLFSAPYRARLLAIFAQASSNFVIHGNCWVYLSLVARNRARENEDVPALIQDKEFVSSLWNAVISKPLQYRAWNSFEEDREALLKMGVNKDWLPIPGWLVRGR